MSQVKSIAKDEDADVESTVDSDNRAAIHAVLRAEDTRLREVLAHDRAVRRALRWRPSDTSAEEARTLVAAARVEQRRRGAEGVLARLLTGGRR
ncbi:hypothetical protein LWC33_28865 [Pseudonocardia sp. RS11V-5]|uniref:hypothetical protein n=1 Tax=Pseudonocardia terrae TaxID=2905831 RepID=UPI001E57E059|nr:hypothetical protein [Pseudonocardia terrae]MCE3555445.1 hypothetical protein [Pseudonocardia terrae]